MELAVIENSLQQVNVKVGEINFNTHVIKTLIEEYLSKYNGLVITEEDTKDMKKEIAFLRKNIKTIDTLRKANQKIYEEPLTAYKNDCKELTELINKTIEEMDSQIKIFENKAKEEKRETINELIKKAETQNSQYNFKVSFNESWLNATYGMKQIQLDLINQAEEFIMAYNLEQERKNMLKEKQDFIQHIIDELNEKNDFETKIKYYEFQYLEGSSISEIKSEIEKVANLRPINVVDKPIVVPTVEETVKVENNIVEEVKLSPKKFKSISVHVTCDEWKNLINYLKGENIEFRVKEPKKKETTVNSQPVNMFEIPEIAL